VTELSDALVTRTSAPVDADSPGQRIRRHLTGRSGSFAMLGAVGQVAGLTELMLKSSMRSAGIAVRFT
jgi:hypothetical protein